MLGMQAENRNMMRRFLINTSASRNWCSYWEIDKWNRPAPVDYQNDHAFWYNLNANFELIYTCERLYRWTGDSAYVFDPASTFFFEKTLHEYIQEWQLKPGELLSRPALPNAPLHFDPQDNYARSRGLPSYVENIDHLNISADLVAAIYRGYAAYADILQFRNKNGLSRRYREKARQYLRHLEKYWWNKAAGQYYSYYTTDGKFGSGEGVLFLLWYDAVQQPERKKSVIEQLSRTGLNVESRSYLPRLLYQIGCDSLAKQHLLYLCDPATPRREYPEVSFGVVEGIVEGYMGIEPDAAANTLTTCFKGQATDYAELDHLEAMQTVLAVKHLGNKKSALTSEGIKTIRWKACFPGKYHRVKINGKSAGRPTCFRRNGLFYTATMASLNPGQTLEIEVE